MTQESTYRTIIENLEGMTVFPRGVSMLPLIKEGTGYVTTVKCEEPQVGDILVFEQKRGDKQANILHRLIRIRPDGVYEMRGDNNMQCEYIHREDIYGRAELICWTAEASRLIPWLLGAERDRVNGGWSVSVTAPGYLRYVRLWSAIWPLRRIFYSFRLRLAHSALWRILHPKAKQPTPKP